MFGGPGGDQLFGGIGNDVLKGGNGQDLFYVYDNEGKDRIKDFQDNIDTLVLDEMLWPGSKTPQEVINDYGHVWSYEGIAWYAPK